MAEETKAVEKKLVPGVGVDVGTSNIVVARRYEDGSFSVKHHRNMLFEMDVNEDSLGLLERSNYLYLKVGNKYYIIGEDALNVVNAIGRGEIVRPMQNGLLNPSLKKSQDLLFYIIKTVLGEPIVKGESVRYSVPANPIDRSDMNNVFHQMVLGSFFSRIGYESKPINEALANIYSEAPSMIIGDKDAVLSGMSVSCGAGMSNVCVAFKGMSVCEFSITKSGDHIDKQVSSVTGESIGRVIRMKEKQLDLSTIDSQDVVLQALSIYYDEFIRRVFSATARELSEKKIRMESPVPIILCGGTAMVPHFVDRMKPILSSLDLPFSVKDVKLSSNPFYSVSQGCCLAAIGDHKRSVSANEQKKD